MHLLSSMNNYKISNVRCRYAARLFQTHRNQMQIVLNLIMQTINPSMLHFAAMFYAVFLHVKRWTRYTVKGGELQKTLGGLRKIFVKLFDYLRALCNCMLCFLFFSYKIDYKTRLWLRLYKWSNYIHQILVQSMPSSWNCKMSIFFCFKIILMKICVC